MSSVVPPTPATSADEKNSADPSLQTSRTDPSLIHQVTSLQKNNQTLYDERRALEAQLKQVQEQNAELTAKMQKIKEEHAAGNRKEMEEFREKFMREWMVCPSPCFLLN